MRLRVVYRPEALADLREIVLFIQSSSGSLVVAERFVRRILDRCERLGYVPLIGRARDDLEPGLRTVPFERSAVIAYKVESDQVRIGNIFYGGRNFEALYRGGAPPDDEDDSEQAKS